MMTWVLIITLYYGQNALAAVPGYEDEVACKTAAEAVSYAGETASEYKHHNPYAFCIPGPRSTK
jgi:hypothetical protein